MSHNARPTEPRHAAPDVHRVLPHNLDAEQGMLGSMLISPTDVIGEFVKAGVSETWFCQPAHAVIYIILVECWQAQQPADVITLTHILRERNRLDEIGGPAFVTHLFAFTPTAANASYYREIVAEFYARRRIIIQAQALLDEAYSPGGDVAELDERIHALAAERSKAVSTGTEVVAMRDLAHAAMDRLLERYEGRGKLRGIGSGIGALDHKTGGWQPGQMIVVAAPEKQGKSSLARQFAEHAAVVEKVPVAYFSHEMSQDEIVDAMIASCARVDSRRVGDGTLADDDFGKITAAAAKLGNAPIFVFDEAHCSLAQYRANVRRAVQEHGARLVVVDYLQLINGGGSDENRQREVASVSRETKLLAKELQIPIIALSQLNDKGATRESMAIQQDLDKLIVIEHENAEAEGDGKAWINVKLQRGGPKGKVLVTWRPAITRFDPVARESSGPTVG